ncbi:hypothetical protein DL238_01845 [Alteriqipengyuania lutimaris]|uniref:Photosynthesis system II assembly factor Ycf48/Hcf136-like domain-containing protein n=1 Tax=Alteriqipengyuania lutimaris TaxID=1538146 RepID=A0A395LHZ3_9SPHN|nr:hypothetical protein DL238_01845 [Alteriqipengyuania lutimaris]
MALAAALGIAGGCTPIAQAPDAVGSPSISAAAELDLADWTTFATEPYQGKRDAVSFVDRDHGWYGTGAGDLFRTTDGGASWQKIASRPGTFVRSVAFLNRTTGFIGNIGTDYYPGVTDETPLYRTDDAGETWTRVDTGDATIKGVCAIDVVEAQRIHQGRLVPRTVIHAAGRVGGPAGILRSVDGGATWTMIDLSDQAGMITDIAFMDENVGFVFGSSNANVQLSEGIVLRTEDGGRTWSEVYRSGRPGEIIWKGHFPSFETGFGTVQSYDGSNAQQRVIRTRDAGATWEELNLVQDAAARQFGIGFIDERRGFVGTMKGGFATNDGGETWRSVPIAQAANKFQILRGEEEGRVYAIGTQLQALDFAYAR